MLLAIDIGNTHTVLGAFEGPQLIKSWRVKSDRNKTSDEFGILFRQLLEYAGVDPRKLCGCVLCSVVPPLQRVVVMAVAQYLGHTPLVVEAGVKSGMKLKVDNPREVGSDRVVNAVAAFDKVKGGAVVVDFGTATTFDCVSPEEEYLGGIITSGIQIGAEALAARTAKLPRIDLEFPRFLVGKNTHNALRAGLTYGYVYMVDGLVTHLKEELGFPLVTIATGGLSSLLAPYSKQIDLVDEHLTLHGLRLIHERNSD